MCPACPSPLPFPTPTCTPPSRRQISSLGLLVSHLPWSKHPQVFSFSYTSLDLRHSNKKVNPCFFHQIKCSTKTLVCWGQTWAWTRKGVQSPMHPWLPHRAPSQAAANPVVSTLPTLESTDKNPNAKNIKKWNKTSTVSQDFQRRLVFSELMYPTGEVLKWLDFMLAIAFKASL